MLAARVLIYSKRACMRCAFRVLSIFLAVLTNLSPTIIQYKQPFEQFALVFGCLFEASVYALRPSSRAAKHARARHTRAGRRRSREERSTQKHGERASLSRSKRGAIEMENNRPCTASDWHLQSAFARRAAMSARRRHVPYCSVQDGINMSRKVTPRLQLLLCTDNMHP